jgi:flagellar assembly protein FliH
LSDTATVAAPASPAGFPLQQLEPSPPPPRDAPSRILAEAHAEAQAIRAQAHAEGRAQGHADGLAETTAAALALGEALKGVHELREQLAADMERDAVELALALAAKILAGALELEPERVVDVVRGALRRVADRRQIVVLVDPSDLEVVTGAVGELQAQAGGIELCEVQADRRVGRGGAVVRTTEGEIDATVSTQMERARELLLAQPCDGEPHTSQPRDDEPQTSQPHDGKPQTSQPCGDEPQT